jgi:hypothetical protein
VWQSDLLPDFRTIDKLRDWRSKGSCKAQNRALRIYCIATFFRRWGIHQSDEPSGTACWFRRSPCEQTSNFNPERKSTTIKNPKVDPPPMSNTEKDPDDWVSGDEPMTGAQASYLKTLSEQLGEPHEFNNR